MIRLARPTGPGAAAARRVFAGALGALLLSCGAAAAAPASGAARNQPIEISAKSVQVNQKTGEVFYRGDVHVVQGDLSIDADHMKVRLHNGQAQRIHLWGSPVILRQRPPPPALPVKATGARADYRVAAGVLEMNGNVTLRRGQDTVTGNHLRYDVPHGQISVEAADTAQGRIHAILQPHPAAGP